jgi:hypothetical protein
MKKYNKFGARADKKGHVFKGVQNFRHLGALINSKNVISHEIKSKISSSNR